LEREVELEGRAGIEGEEVGGALRCREECRRGDGESMAFWSVPDERRAGRTKGREGERAHLEIWMYATSLGI